LSYLRLIGKEESLRIARKYTDQALSELAKVASGVKKEELVAFVQDLIKRDF
jgi:geranylgeranyl pyrophosphate synthase